MCWHWSRLDIYLKVLYTKLLSLLNTFIGNYYEANKQTITFIGSSMKNMHSLPRSHFKATKYGDPWCKACGGRHYFEQCSIHAPTQPPQHDAPAREAFGPCRWPCMLPPAPGNATVFRGRFKFPLASFHWRRMIHSLLWKYSNTEQDSHTVKLRVSPIEAQPDHPWHTTG